MTSLIDKILKLADNDDENRNDQSDILKHQYETGTDFVKAMMDNVCICLCGYGIGSILSEKEEVKKLLEALS